MVKVTNDFGDRYSGKVGDSGVFASIWGIQYRRRFVKPSNPNTPAQQRVRTSFTNGVDKWHTFNPLQAQAYTPMASGQKMSGYNLFLSRWQKMTSVQKAAYVEPIDCIKQIASGSATEDQTESVVQNQREYTLTSTHIVRDSVTFTKSTGSLDPYLLVDIIRGKVTVLKTISSACTISYTAGGLTVTDEAVTSSASAGEIIELDNWDIDYKSVVVKVGGTEEDAVEVDVNAGKLWVTKSTTFTAGGSFGYDKFTPLENANIKMVKTNTNFNTLNAYSDENGEVRFAQTTEDGNRDINITEPDHLAVILGNVTPTNACSDELIEMTSI